MMDSSILVLKIGLTSLLVIWKLISSLSVLLANMSGEAKFLSGATVSNAIKNDSI